LAAGTPVVAVAAPYVHETCDYAALLVDKRPDAFADAVRDVIDDEEPAELPS
jgi:glycosyltransferase involved in cell wall biosynthesis